MSNIQFGPFSFIAGVSDIVSQTESLVILEIKVSTSKMDVPVVSDCHTYELITSDRQIKVGDLIFVMDGYSSLDLRRITAKGKVSILGTCKVPPSRIKEALAKQATPVTPKTIKHTEFKPEQINDPTVPAWQTSPAQIS